MNTDAKKCAHPACKCTVSKDGQYGDYCSENCRLAKDMSEVRCACGHAACRAA